jgi:hypothetical protein
MASGENAIGTPGLNWLLLAPQLRLRGLSCFLLDAGSTQAHQTGSGINGTLLSVRPLQSVLRTTKTHPSVLLPTNNLKPMMMMSESQ